MARDPALLAKDCGPRAELAHFMREASGRRLPNWCPVKARDFLNQTANTLEQWAKVCEQLL